MEKLTVLGTEIELNEDVLDTLETDATERGLTLEEYLEKLGFKWLDFLNEDGSISFKDVLEVTFMSAAEVY